MTSVKLWSVLCIWPVLSSDQYGAWLGEWVYYSWFIAGVSVFGRTREGSLPIGDPGRRSSKEEREGKEPDL